MLLVYPLTALYFNITAGVELDNYFWLPIAVFIFFSTLCLWGWLENTLDRIRHKSSSFLGICLNFLFSIKTKACPYIEYKDE